MMTPPSDGAKKPRNRKELRADRDRDQRMYAKQLRHEFWKDLWLKKNPSWKPRQIVIKTDSIKSSIGKFLTDAAEALKKG